MNGLKFIQNAIALSMVRQDWKSHADRFGSSQGLDECDDEHAEDVARFVDHLYDDIGGEG